VGCETPVSDLSVASEAIVIAEHLGGSGKTANRVSLIVKMCIYLIRLIS